MTAMANPNEYREASGFIAEIIRTNRRKSADIRVEEGAVSIVVPSETPLEKIDQLLASKRRGIKEKMALHQQAAPACSHEFVSGEAFPYLGRNYRLKIETGAFAPVKLVHGRLLITLSSGLERPHMVRNALVRWCAGALVRWYKRQAEQKLKEKVERFAPVVGVSPPFGLYLENIMEIRTKSNGSRVSSI